MYLYLRDRKPAPEDGVACGGQVRVVYRRGAGCHIRITPTYLQDYRQSTRNNSI